MWHSKLLVSTTPFLFWCIYSGLWVNTCAQSTTSQDAAAFDDTMPLYDNPYDDSSAAAAAMEETLREIEEEMAAEGAELEDIALDAQRAASAEEEEIAARKAEAEHAARAATEEKEKKSKSSKRRQNILNMYRTESRAERQKRKRGARDSVGAGSTERRTRSRVPGSTGSEENAKEGFEARYTRFSDDKRYAHDEIDETEDPSRALARERLRSSSKHTVETMERCIERLLAADERGSTYYKILKVKRTTSGMTEIKQAYRRLALEAHPDKNLAKRAPQGFKVLQDAYDTLTSDREKYDRYLVKRERVKRQRFRRRAVEAFQDATSIGMLGWSRMIAGSKQALFTSKKMLSWNLLIFALLFV
mmetsp:Transcript_20113/g.27325  ORF Transcript_20113/g.27325 Transcript_20113/m.27325 type:complete len:361 (-) Transcript_20113:235-1317(-)